jgi:hypothetical protein
MKIQTADRMTDFEEGIFQVLNEKKRQFWIKFTAIVLAILMGAGTLFTLISSIL